MDRPLEQVQETFLDFFSSMAKRVSDPEAERRWNYKAPEEHEVRLSFETQRIQAAKSISPVNDILLNASTVEVNSYDATVPVTVRRDTSAFQAFTMQTRITINSFRKSQFFMLICTSFMGLLTGLLISFFL